MSSPSPFCIRYVFYDVEYIGFHTDFFICPSHETYFSISWLEEKKTVSLCFRVLCTGSKDRRTRVLAVHRLKNLSVYDLGGLRDSVVGAFFDYNSLDVSFISLQYLALHYCY